MIKTPETNGPIKDYYAMYCETQTLESELPDSKVQGSSIAGSVRSEHKKLGSLVPDLETGTDVLREAYQVRK